jgi:hypothetical protein
MSCVKNAASGQNLGRAALSATGNMVLKRIERQTGPVISAAARRLPMQREIDEVPSAPPAYRTGIWIRRDNRLVVLRAFPGSAN